MQANQSPALVTLPFAANGLKNVIPEATQAGIAAGAASLNDGFPPATMQPKTQGGIPPDGKDFNGILFLLSAVARWLQAGGSSTYDPAFLKNANLGGYPKGALVLRADLSGFWFNTADNNTTNPDATDGSARNWVALNADWNATGGPGLIRNKPQFAKVAFTGDYNDLSNAPTSLLPVGAGIPFFGGVVPAGFLMANGAAISRTTYAALFAVIGTTYGAGNGSTTFNLPDTRGVVLRGLDNGRGLDPGRTLGSYQGDSFSAHAHALNDPLHTHGVWDGGHSHPVSDGQHWHAGSNGSAFFNDVGSGGDVNVHIDTGQTNADGRIGLFTATASSNVSVGVSGSSIGLYASATGITIGTSGGSETRGKNLVANYLIKY